MYSPIPNLEYEPFISLDTETTGTYYPRDKAFGVSISTREHDYYWDLRDEPHMVEQLQRLVDNYKGDIACHNASFDAKMCKVAGISIPLEKLVCTCVNACLINEHESTVFPWTRGKAGDYSLDHLAQKYLGLTKDHSFYAHAQEHFGKKMTKNQIMGRIAELPRHIVEPYAKQDTRVTYQLHKRQLELIDEQGIHQIVQFERETMPRLIRAEMRGVDVDVEETERAMPKLTEIIDQKQAELNRIAGKEINVNSTPQIRELFAPTETDDGWVAKDGTPLQRTKSGSASFGGNALRDISLPEAAIIVDIRSLIKTRDTFLGSHILKHEVNGKVYPNINQCKGEDGGTGTGRLSYTGPALQQIPARNKAVASIVKPCFLPPQGMKWVEPDLASFEVRVFAHLVAAYNDALVHAYAKNPSMDFHQWVGDMTNLPRNATYSGEANAKQLNLSMIFNQGNGTTAETMGMDWEWAEFTDREGKLVRYKKAGPKAQSVINNYHRQVQGVKTLADRCKMVAEERGYIKTKMGRRLRFPHKYKSYKASGILIQATSADINKRNWGCIEDALGNDGHLILNTHDSYSLACPEDWRPHFARVKEAIEDVSDIGLRVPLILDLDGAGDNWWQAKCGQEK